MKALEQACLMRDAGAVKRFHTVRMLRSQPVAEHSFNMLLLLQQVWPTAPARLLRAVIHHDLPELVTGDVPAPTKRNIPSLSIILEEAERGAGPLYRDDEDLTTYEQAVLKWVDYMELALWCMEEMNMGNMYALPPFTNVMIWVQGMLVYGADQPAGPAMKHIYDAVARHLPKGAPNEYGE